MYLTWWIISLISKLLKKHSSTLWNCVASTDEIVFVTIQKNVCHLTLGPICFVPRHLHSLFRMHTLHSLPFVKYAFVVRDATA